ncbi:MAG: hypothetical protein JO042_05365, partial [Sinobacteraceae bacterium]|nr:hypothetical protein [Nevskiaceae bacterium]
VQNRRAGSALAIPLILMAAAAHTANGAISGSQAQLLKLVDQSSASYIATSRQIWEHPELGYKESQSSAALQAALRKDGFTVTSPVADEPTGFIATYGEGKPVIGILETSARIEPLTPFDPNSPAASTDVGDVSWNYPTIGFVAATFVPGVAPHTWQAAASAGMSIGQHGMVVAAKALALTGADLFASPQLVADAHQEFERQLQGKKYRSFIPEGQKPPLDYDR